MKKRVRPADTDTLRKMIDEAEGKAQLRCLSPQDIVNAIKVWEHNAFNPPAARLIGCTMTVQASGAKFAKAYKYAPMETVAVLKHDTVGWYVVSVERRYVRSHGWRVEVDLTEAAHSWILAQARCSDF